MKVWLSPQIAVIFFTISILLISCGNKIDLPQNGTSNQNLNNNTIPTLANNTKKTATPEFPAPPTILEKPSLSKPNNSSFLPSNKEITLIWNQNASASQYKVELWRDANGSMIPCDWQNSTLCHIGIIYPGRLSWRVRARDASGQESEWSDTWTFTITKSSTTTPTPILIALTGTSAKVPTSTNTFVTFTPTETATSTESPTPTDTSTPTEAPTPTETFAPLPGGIVLLDGLALRTESGIWPPQSGQKLIAHIKIQNSGNTPVHIQYMGVKGRRNGTEFWDIGFWAIDLTPQQVWSLDPNNERPLVSGNYTFQISFSLDGTTWVVAGNEISFTVP